MAKQRKKQMRKANNVATRTKLNHPACPFMGLPDPVLVCPVPHILPAGDSAAAQAIFREALSIYLHSFTTSHMLTRHARKLVLIAINGLCNLNHLPLARVLILISFSDLTADEILNYITLARTAQHDADCTIPF